MKAGATGFGLFLLHLNKKIMNLKKSIGSLEVKGLGITLNQNSTEHEIKMAIKHQPNIAQFIEGTKQSAKVEK